MEYLYSFPHWQDSIPAYCLNHALPCLRARVKINATTLKDYSLNNFYSTLVCEIYY